MKFEIMKRENAKYCFHIKDEKNSLIARSEDYTQYTNCKRAVESIIESLPVIEVHDFCDMSGDRTIELTEFDVWALNQFKFDFD